MVVIRLASPVDLPGARLSGVICLACPFALAGVAANFSRVFITCDALPVLQLANLFHRAAAGKASGGEAALFGRRLFVEGGTGG